MKRGGDVQIPEEPEKKAKKAYEHKKGDERHNEAYKEW